MNNKRKMKKKKQNKVHKKKKRKFVANGSMMNLKLLMHLWPYNLVQAFREQGEV
jgi:hypothetical protein